MLPPGSPLGWHSGRWRRRRGRELAPAVVRAAGPVRGRRAPRSSLARLLCSYLDSAARAQEFPVMPPAAPSVARSREGGGRRTAAAARLPRSVRRTLPRPLALCLGLCLASAAATTLPGECANPSCPIRPRDPAKSGLGPHPPHPGSVRATPPPRASSPGRRAGAGPRDVSHRGTARNEVRREPRAPPASALTPYPSPTANLSRGSHCPRAGPK